MGCFDSLRVRCQVCGEDNYFQSKADECICATYDLTDVPDKIALDLDGQSKNCTNCNNEITIKVHKVICTHVI